MAKKVKSQELGFGTLAARNGQRFMNADGSANVMRLGGPRISASDIFHKLTTMKWSKFFVMVFIAYIITNLLFASIYYYLGVEHLGMVPTDNFWKDFSEAFFFSTQCLTTIGFGRVSPHGLGTNVVASTEGLVGLLAFALATGLLYGRFSRPRAHLTRSENLIIAPYRVTQRAAMFRIASTRKYSILIENTVAVSLGINHEENGELRRRFYVLDLELEKINFLNLSWTVVHPITESSPLWGKTMDDLKRERAEIIVLFKALDETTSQTVIERFSYFVDEMVWGAKFVSAIAATADGKPVLDMDKLGLIQKVDLPPLTVDETVPEASHHGTRPAKA
jgi:inward rectifier potassium channel